jgi:RNA polymerase sigma-70 factor (ECF subfamily)
LRDLAILSQQGDQEAYRRFLKRLHPYIHGALRRKLGSLVDQEDLTQECLLGIHRNLASYQPDQPIKPWVSAVIRYKLADHFRKQARSKEVTLENYEEKVTKQAASANNEVANSKREASEIFKALPNKYRRALEMTHVQGLSYREAAQQEGISETALRKRISRAFAKVRAEVEKNGEILD